MPFVSLYASIGGGASKSMGATRLNKNHSEEVCVEMVMVSNERESKTAINNRITYETENIQASE